MARVRRTFTPEFKRDAVALVTREGKTVSFSGLSGGANRDLVVLAVSILQEDASIISVL